MKIMYDNKRPSRKLKESEDRLMTRYYNRDGLKPWRGCRSIKFKSNGTQSDPDLIYKNYVFNYWDIEDALWNDFLEYNGITEKDVYDGNNIRPDIEKQFDQFVCDMAPSYLDDYIANGAPKNWHSKYEGYRNLSERNLTRAERYNKESNKIFSYKRALDKEMKRYLVDNGVPEDEAEKLLQDDKLDYKLRELGLHDDFFDMWLSRKYGYDKSGEYYYIPESVSKRTGRSLKEYYVDDEFLSGDKVRYFNDFYEAKKYAESLGLKESEYGSAYGCSYCMWNKTGDRNDIEEVVAYYEFKGGKPVKLSYKAAEKLKYKTDVDFLDDDDYSTSYLCYDIEYDIQPEDLDMDDDDDDFEEERERIIASLPTELEVEIDPDYPYDIEDALVEEISAETGWLVDSFNYKRI